MNSFPFGDLYRGKSVFLTGHTGFKGSWMAHWLLELGAEVHGFALAPGTTPALFDQLGLTARLHHETGDLRDAGAVRRALLAAQPDFVFHLGAQAILRASYEEPVETYQVNVLGTIHVMEALRELKKPCTAVFVTTDKCYENREWFHGYREEDPLGGHDPYSSSKAAAEIAIASWRRSFFKVHPVRIASARAGNVVGGGDWAKDRIVPDCIRSLQASHPIRVRNPKAKRPWQHVLEPLGGYLWLAACLTSAPRPLTSDLRPLTSDLASAINFGPALESNVTVAELVTEVLKHWPGRWEDRSDPGAVHEAKLLHLSTDKAGALLGWFPVWHFPQTIAQTVSWYRQTAAQPQAAASLTSTQIASYSSAAAQAALPWAPRPLTSDL